MKKFWCLFLGLIVSASIQITCKPVRYVITGINFSAVALDTANNMHTYRETVAFTDSIIFLISPMYDRLATIRVGFIEGAYAFQPG